MEESTLKEKNLLIEEQTLSVYPFALRKAKIVYNFGLSECNRVKRKPHFGKVLFAREANRMSQKLSAYEKMAETREKVSIHQEKIL